MVDVQMLYVNQKNDHMIMLFYCREMMDMEPLYWLMTLNSLANPWVYLAFNWNLLCLGRLRRGSNSDTQM